ncbi:MAG TPA: DUF6776 family protein [Methylibium sp.]
MRWKLLRRRLSISSPRMTVRSHLPWPLRWAAVALMCGFSAAIALWAFEFGKDIAGLDHRSAADIAALKRELEQLRQERDQAQAIANTADSLLKAGTAAQDKLAAQVKALETQNLALRGDLGFFERLLPAGGGESLAVRALQAEVPTAGQLHFQLLVMQQGKARPEFHGSYEFTLSGELQDKPWSQAMPGGARPLQFKQYQRLDGVIDYPAAAVVKLVQVKVMDHDGGVRATQSLHM